MLKLFVLLTLLAAATLAILSFRVWLYDVRKHLPAWRSILGVASIAATLMSLLTLAIPFFLSTLGVVSSFSFEWLDMATWLVAVSIPLGIALRGTARIELLSADLLLVALFYATVSF